eukprot:scpid4423/ scgid5538/ Structural maintenance of chromosomes flexible hinge domain-containing protein 1
MDEDEDTYVYVYDRRKGADPPSKISLGGVFKFANFQALVKENLQLAAREKFIICTTSRHLIKDDDTYENLVNANDTLYVLTHLHQELSAPAAQRVEYVPHHDTIVKSGMYEYYASEGQNPLSYAFAELIDNSLSATRVVEKRSIEVQLVFDDNSGHSVYVIDNGTGMSTRKLNDWAIYRLSKQSRHHSDVSFTVDTERVSRFLNSDISYFGVGGKQAIFFIGSAVRMITREIGSDDVHELFLSKDGFDQKARERQPVYTGEILNRPPGDHHHVTASAPADHLTEFIESEPARDNFTAVVITGVSPGHVQYLRYHFKHWCRQLAHIYHYYLHGPQGNVSEGNSKAANGAENGTSKKSTSSKSSVSGAPFEKIDIKVSLFEKGKPPVIVQLSEINDDLQTQYIRSSASSFEFCAEVDGIGSVEGVLRYHPFHFDHETIPQLEDPNNVDGEEKEVEKNRALFECYWNGRLIPYTNIQSLEWSQVKRTGNVPEECFHRVSGVLWSDSHFQVSTNKLTFIDLPSRLQEKSTWYSRVVRGVEQRCPHMQRAFLDWLKESHELYDKQVKFMGFKDQIRRKDVAQKRMQSPWSVFDSIEWDGKTFRKGQLVRIHRVLPVVLGRVKRFLLFGEHEGGDLYATGGEIEIAQEPVSLFTETKVYPLSKLDRACTKDMVQALIAEEERKLPSQLDVTFPDGNAIENNAKLPCDSILGAIGVEILNGHGDPMSKLVGERQKQLMVEQRIVHHTPSGDKDIVKLCSRHGGKKWAYWFGAVEFRSTGTYTLSLQAIVGNDQTSSSTSSLPSIQIKFTVTEGKAVKFSVGVLDGPFRIGKPFKIPISLHDRLENRTPLPSGITPVLAISGMQVSFKDISKKGGECIMNGVVILGKVDSTNGKDVSMSVQVPSLDSSTQKMKIRLLPGLPSSLEVQPDDEPIHLESGRKLELKVRVKDAAGNPASDNRMAINCKLTGAPHLETLSAVASNGDAVLSCCPKVTIKNMKPVILKAVVDMPHHRSTVSSVERRIEVVPSCQPASIQVFRQPMGNEMRSGDDEMDQVEIDTDSEIGIPAGETLSGLSFQVLDEGGRNVEVVQALASKIQVNWVAKPNVELLKAGKLPDIKAPSTVGEVKFCQVSLSGQSPLSFSFSVDPLPGPAEVLKCISSNNVVRIESPTTTPLIITLHDKQGNQLKKISPSLLSSVTITGAKLRSHDPPEITDECIKIRNIVFDVQKLAVEDVVVKIGEMSATYSFQVMPGKPSQVRIVDCQPEEVFTIYNDGRLPIPLKVQLYDDYGNPSGLEGVRMQLGKSGGLKLSPPTQHQRTDGNGQVNFGFTSVRAERGDYFITPRAIYGQTTIVGASLRICVEPDPSRVVAVEVTPAGSQQCTVAQNLPELSCVVMAEDGHPFAGALPSHVKMELLRGGSVVSTYSPSTPGSDTEGGRFPFSGHDAPVNSGTLQARFKYCDGSVTLQSRTVDIEVSPGPPCRLVSDCVPSAVAVSNGAVINQRKIVERLELRIKDEHGNNCIDDSLSGTVHVTLQADSGGTDARNVANIPTFDGGSRMLSFPLAAGSCVIQRLLVAQDCPGVDGHQYTAYFTVESPHFESNQLSVQPFLISFMFCNDGHKQRQLSSLTTDKDKLQSSIEDLKQFFAKHEQELKTLRGALNEQEHGLNRLKLSLTAGGFTNTQVSAMTQNPMLAQHQVDSYRKEYQLLESAPRRRCLLENVPPHYTNDRDVIGKVAHLALVEDDDVARVLSWHMGNDMDCCITSTTEKAMSVNEQCGGRQQMLALDSIYKKALPQWDKPLPHAKVLRNEPRGNPQYVKHYLKFTGREEECRQVFGLLLGEVILLDTLADAAHYRQQLANYTRCPTLLTRDGDRIRSTGKFGGYQNKAPQLDKLRVVFGAPAPERLSVLTHQIELLQAFQQQLSNVAQSKLRLDTKIGEAQGLEFRRRLSLCKEKEEEVTRIDGQIRVLSPKPPTTRPSRTGASAVSSPLAASTSVSGAAASVGASSSTPRRGRPPVNRAANSSTPVTTVSASLASSDAFQQTRGVRTRTPSSSRQSPNAKRRRYN